MVLALDYMQSTKTLNPELETKARRYVDAGYKRLLGFEVKSEPGGFDWWGKPPANLFLSAYGLMEFLDMAKVHDVDPDLFKRIRTYLRKHQAEDGSWSMGGARQPWSITWKKSAFNMTAYISWALARAGADTTKSRAWLTKHVDEVDDPYGIALASMAFLIGERDSAIGSQLVTRLVKVHQRDETGAFWTAAGETHVGGRGHTAQLETSALAVLALLADGSHSELAYAGLDALIARRGADGRFGSTHSTILCLKALLASESGNGPLPGTGVAVMQPGKPARMVHVPKGSTEPIRIDLGEMDPRKVKATMRGEGRLSATLSRTTYERWAKTKLPKGPLALEITWPEETMEAEAKYVATVTIRNTGKIKAKTVTAEIGLPPGITIKPDEVSGKGLEEAERSRRAMVLYLRTVKPGESFTFKLPFRTRFPFRARTAPSRVYEYYVEHEQTVVPPVLLETR